MATTHEPSPFGLLLRQYRAAAGLSQEELAKRAHLSRRGISDLERGERRSPHPGTARRLAQALNLEETQRASLLASIHALAGSDRSAGQVPDEPQRMFANVQRSGLESLTTDQVDVAMHHNLPVHLTSFVGRAQEAAEIRNVLGNTRLLTLTGPGGVGKTRLALQVAQIVASSYAAGAWLVELASLQDPDLVPQSIARALGLRDVPDEPLTATLQHALHDRQLLLILDNCEHVVSACGDLVEHLLRACPQLRVLTTSRERLAVDGESTWPVPPLSLMAPGAGASQRLDSDAVRLFVERAQAVQSEFALSDQNAGAVAAICRIVEGLPMAIELAAARVRVLLPEEIAARLRQGIALLANGSRSKPERQRTMRAALDWSYELLSDRERNVFDRLSVFAGGCSLEAAEAVCAGDDVDCEEVLDLLTSIVDKSLLKVESGGPQSRFRLLEPLRQYAAERLTGRGTRVLADVRYQHAEYFLGLARRSFAPVFEASAAELRDSASEQTGWLDHLERDHDNVRVALSWLLNNGRVEEAQRMGATFWQFWSIRGYFSEGATWMRRILELPGGYVPTRVRVLSGAGFLAFTYDDLASARQYDSQALILAREIGDCAAVAMAQFRLGDVARAQGAFAEAHLLLQAAMETSRAIPNPGPQAHCRFGLGNLALAEGDLVAARGWLADALARFRDLGNRRSAAVAARRLGVTQYQLGERTAGRVLLEDSLSALRAMGDRWQMAMVLWELGAVATTEGDFGRAWEFLSEGLRLSRDVADRGRVSWYLQAFARLALAQDQPYRAVLLERAASVLGDTLLRGQVHVDHSPRAGGWQWSVMGLSSIAGDYAVLESQLHLASVRLGQRRSTEARNAAREMTLDEAIAYATATGDLRKVEAHPAGRLSPREREVAALVARGLSNRTIATQLSITERTAGAHVEHILDKLGFTSRTQIGVWAAEHALLTRTPS